MKPKMATGGRNRSTMPPRTLALAKQENARGALVWNALAVTSTRKARLMDAFGEQFFLSSNA